MWVRCTSTVASLKIMFMTNCDGIHKGITRTLAYLLLPSSPPTLFFVLLESCGSL